jgi:6-phosphogluconolactonase/glucosamine-6-phosphate isomerase/deaminase
MDIIESVTPQADAGRALGDLLAQYVHTPILLLVSGGSAFSLLEYVDASVLDPRVTLGVLDERLSLDPAVNNFAQLTQTSFYTRALTQGVVPISTLVSSGDTLEDIGERMRHALRAWRMANPTGIVIATMGIGADGHTAGIFPVAGVDFDGGDIVVEYTIPAIMNPYTDRITVTNTFLREQVAHAVVLAVDSEKRRLIEMLKEGVCEKARMPACILRAMPSVTLYTEKA